MIALLLAWSVRQRVVVVLASVVLAAAGIGATTLMPLDAIPDLSETQVLVVTEWAGRSPESLEDQVTRPLVLALRSVPGVTAARGVSDVGVSHVYVVFGDGVDRPSARARVLERLATSLPRLPEGVRPIVGPDAGPTGWVFEYALADPSGSHDLAELRAIQDWSVAPALSAVPGVAEVATIGGAEKQYQVQIDPVRLVAAGSTVTNVIGAIQEANGDVDGKALEFGGREHMVRSRGALASQADVAAVVVSSRSDGRPLRVGDVAEVRSGPAQRRGLAELDGLGEVVGGIVVMRFGENAARVVSGVRAAIEDLRESLPAGVTIVTTYDRSELIAESAATLIRILVEASIAVVVVILVFLGHLRSALIPIAVMLVAVAAAFLPMHLFDISSNVMSLGGIALALGVLVDATLVMLDNVHRRTAGLPASPNALVAAVTEVARPVALTMAIIVVSFIPVLLLQAEEGRLFRPLAFSKTFVMTGGAVLALTLVPALLRFLLVGQRLQADRANRATRAIVRAYAPLLRTALRHWKATLAVNLLVVAATLPLVATIGREFMPPMYEGALLFMPTTDPGLSVSESSRIVQMQDRALARVPEVRLVFGSAGRSTSPTDNSPLSMVNTIVQLRPRHEWRDGLSIDALIDELDRAARLPGVTSGWTRPIRGRVDMLHTGLQAPLGIKVLGSEIEGVDALAAAVEHSLAGLPETRGVYAERVLRGVYASVHVDDEVAARYGVRRQDVNTLIDVAVGGREVSRTIEGRARHAIAVRYQAAYRQNVWSLEHLPIALSDGRHVPLGAVAQVRIEPGPASIRNEGGRPAAYVSITPQTDDVGAYVETAERRLAATVHVPAGYRLEWTGEHASRARATNRLTLVVPLALLAIYGLLVAALRSFVEALVVMLSVVVAFTGGLVLQWALGYNFSVAVWVGYLALFGVAVQTGVIMVMYLQESVERRCAIVQSLTDDDLRDAILEGSIERLRPKLMTVAATVLGLAPILWSTGAGSDVLKPIATPIIGGMITSALHVLIVTPLLFYATQRSRHRLSSPPTATLSA